MAADSGTQTVTLLYHNRADSKVVNRRFTDIRKTGIYSGGYLTVVDNSHALLSTLICEITDSTYQVKISTGATVTIAVASATPYIVLRWTYTGSQTNDYMSILAVASPSANDLIVAECTFTGGGNLQGFDYTERSTPSTQDLFLKVEPTADTELRVRVRVGRVHSASGVLEIPDQKTSLFIVPTSNSRIDLVYINLSTGAVSIQQGTAAASPVAPDYNGKLVLAEIILTSTSTNITSSMIKDVRNFVATQIVPDNTTLALDSSTGKLKLVTITAIRGARTSKDSLGNELVRSSVYKATSDGDIQAYGYGSDIFAYVGSSNPPTILIDRSGGGATEYGSVSIRLIKNEYFKITGASSSLKVYWHPIGSGQCVKQ